MLLLMCYGYERETSSLCPPAGSVSGWCGRGQQDREKGVCPKGNLGKGPRGFVGYKCVGCSLAALLQLGEGNSKNLRAREVLK